MYLNVVVSSDDLLIDYIFFGELDGDLDLFLDTLLVMAGVVAILLEDALVEDVLTTVRDVILRKLVIVVAVVEDVVATVIGDVWAGNFAVVTDDRSITVVEKVVVAAGHDWSNAVVEDVIATGLDGNVIVAIVEDVVAVLLVVVAKDVFWIIEDAVATDIFVGLIVDRIRLHITAENVVFWLVFRRILNENVSS